MSVCSDGIIRLKIMFKSSIFKSLPIGIAIVVIYGCIHKWKENEVLPSDESVTTIHLEKIDVPVYLKSKKWGISGNHEEIVLSMSNRNVSNKELDYIFYTDEIYYKTDNLQTITIYAPESLISVPLKKSPNVVVIINGLKNADQINDISLNYKKYGLKKVPN
jgi:hypothetical protein